MNEKYYTHTTKQGCIRVKIQPRGTAKLHFENFTLKRKVQELEEQIKYLEYLDSDKFSTIQLLSHRLNELNAAIERLKAECGNQSTLWSQHYESIFETVKETIKAEAIKEFAERLKTTNGTMDKRIVSVERIDNLVKEMGGEHNAN